MAANSFQEERDTPEYATVAELAANLVYRLPGCDDVLIRRALREAYVEFCRLANALVTEQTIELEKGETDYPVTSCTPDCRVECVRRVCIRHHVLREGLDYGVAAGIPPTIRIRERLLPERDGDERTLLVQCLEMPNSGSERIPRWFVRKYGDAICAGALVRLYSMSEKRWTDIAQARIELCRWEGYVAGARIGSVGGSPFGNGHINTVDTSELL